MWTRPLSITLSSKTMYCAECCLSPRRVEDSFMKSCSRIAVSLTAAALLFSQAAVAATTYKQDPAKSTIGFAFTQAGAVNQGKFVKFDVSFVFSPDGVG